MSDQTLLEIIVAGMAGKSVFLEEDTHNVRSLNDWNGITLNDGGYVTAISWSPFRSDSGQSPIVPGGSLNLDWLPSHVRMVRIIFLQLSGTIETASLPRGLADFNISGNHMSGTFDTTGLPQDLESVVITRNKFEGSLDVSVLPHKLTHFDASYNTFRGFLDLTNLPSTLTGIYLHVNEFEGSVCLETLPAGLQTIRLIKNILSQKELRVGLPKGQFQEFAIDWENFGN
eukprot:CAMPEP_0201530470 /NCGR_PEP_ID=MMETSP0161_2-20130828/44778_1 /ASSEMBLY_ACC=CAM_ASM_000251 /TAXON_ID=180227 /ORGANISM="Neoparamoeba aestuarina, Strain SoJaBio B1-5/56/2" /LENGTH=228 /DNA_ID=CAMNT_0047932849 /DNA_START=6 /DNA_END=689 /DNA_ORIENTATION=+